jgi:hypothetical protein
MNAWTGITAEQYAKLLEPLGVERVAKRTMAGRQLSYLEAWDVKAHLIRIFGFGEWSADVLSADLVYEEKGEKNWAVAYKVVLKLTIHSTFASYTEAAIGSAQLPQRGEAHDMAVKTAESDALKRAAINLGTQFGLSLYDDGSRKDVVGATLNVPEGVEAAEPVVVPDMTSTVADILAATDEMALKAIWDALEAVDHLGVVVEGHKLSALIGARVAEMRGM